jgi:hypothetical protein
METKVDYPFDGKTTKGWRAYMDKITPGWIAKDGELQLTPD